MRDAIIFENALDDEGADSMDILASITDGLCVLESMSKLLKIRIVLDKDDVQAILALWDGRREEATE